MDNRFFLNAKPLAFRGIQDYQDKKRMPGLHHGELGCLRARNVKAYLDLTDTDEEFLAAMLAIFGDFDKNFLGFKIQSSTGLIGLIAGKWILGDYFRFISPSVNVLTDTLTSPVFSNKLINKSKTVSLTSHPYGASISEYYDKIRAANYLLHEILRENFSEKKQSQILAAAEKLNKLFTKELAEKKSVVKGTMFNPHNSLKPSEEAEATELETFNMPRQEL